MCMKFVVLRDQLRHFEPNLYVLRHFNAEVIQKHRRKRRNAAVKKSTHPRQVVGQPGDFRFHQPASKISEWKAPPSTDL